MHHPGYIDVQVNGYAGVDFNRDGLTAEALHTACERLRADGTAGALPTIVTEDLPIMCGRLRRIAELRERDALAREVILGLHIEGPFLNETPGYIGAHPPDAARPADVDAMNRLLDAACGLTKIVTLSPERDPGMRVTKMLAGRSIRVAAGHSDASLDELRAAIDAGLSMFTHLGNGCPMTLHRHDNITQRVLSLADKLWITFIADGAHVPPPALGNYLRCAGLERAIIVTDAAAPAGAGPGTYTLGRQTLVVGEEAAPSAPGGTHFIGSASTMPRMVRVLREQVGLNEVQITQIARENAVRLLGGDAPPSFRFPSLLGRG